MGLAPVPESAPPREHQDGFRLVGLFKATVCLGECGEKRLPMGIWSVNFLHFPPLPSPSLARLLTSILRRDPAPRRRAWLVGFAVAHPSL